jgi:hypothetical protein
VAPTWMAAAPCVVLAISCFGGGRCVPGDRPFCPSYLSKGLDCLLDMGKLERHTLQLNPEST